jgi:hypothetical protein
MNYFKSFQRLRGNAATAIANAQTHKKPGAGLGIIGKILRVKLGE